MSEKKPSWVSLSAAYNALHGDGGSPFHVATDRGNGWLSGIRAAISDAVPRGRVVVYDDNMRATAERLRAIVGAHDVEIVVNRLPYMRADTGTPNDKSTPNSAKPGLRVLDLGPKRPTPPMPRYATPAALMFLGSSGTVGWQTWYDFPERNHVPLPHLAILENPCNESRLEPLEDALLDLYVRVDGLLLAGDFAAVDRSLAAVDVDTSPLIVLLAWLSITAAAADRLAERAAFARKVATRVNRDEPAERAAGLLRGLV